jgi:hypothetical protein
MLSLSCNPNRIRCIKHDLLMRSKVFANLKPPGSWSLVSRISVDTSVAVFDVTGQKVFFKLSTKSR